MWRVIRRKPGSMQVQTGHPNWTLVAACAMEGAMNGASDTGPRKPAKISRAMDREGRLKAALKANMARRKAQARVRTQDAAANVTGRDNDKE